VGRLAKANTVDCREQIVELNQNRYFDMCFFRIDYWGFDIAWISKLEHSSCSHTLHQWAYPQYFHHPFEIVGKYMQTHFCADMIQCFHLKMGCPHPCFERAKWMLNSLLAYQHGFRHVIKAYLHGIKYGFMFPASNTAFCTWCALVFQRTNLTTRIPVGVERFSLFDRGVTFD